MYYDSLKSHLAINYIDGLFDLEIHIRFIYRLLQCLHSSSNNHDIIGFLFCRSLK